MAAKLRSGKKEKISERCQAGAVAALEVLAKGHTALKANDAFEMHAGHRLAYRSRRDMVRLCEFYAKGGK